MTTTDTMDTQATVKQSIALFDAGAELVRITAPGPKDAENLGAIKSELRKRGYEQPLVADIHFSPKTAMIALEHVEKVRINPGNFVDRKRFEIHEYTDEQYQEGLEALKESFLPLVQRAKTLGRVLRIGSNHGSLSDRIMNRYGDTPLGMIESALEFIRFARQANYHDIVVSMKSSNPQIMVQAYRLLSAHFYEHGYDYPLHLGVTEAGGERDGRMKSALGIGSLLMDGIGDTIRVSLTEDPVQEIYAAKEILKVLAQRQLQQKTQNNYVKESKHWEANYSKQISFYESKRMPSRELSLASNKIKRTSKQSQILPSTPISMGAQSPYRVFVNINLSHQNREGAGQGPLKEAAWPALSQSEWQKELQKLQARGCDALWSYGLPKDSFIKAADELHLVWVQDLGAVEIQELILEKLPIHSQAAAVSIDLDLEQLKQSEGALKELQTKLKQKKQCLFLHCILSLEEVQDCLEFLAEARLFKQGNLILSLSIKSKNGLTHNLDLVFAYRLLCAYKKSWWIEWIKMTSRLYSYATRIFLLMML